MSEFLMIATVSSVTLVGVLIYLSLPETLSGEDSPE
jgi:hypothetical protein